MPEAATGKARLKKVCLLSDHHICINPRLWKEAFFYEKLGCEVSIINMWQSNQLLKKDMELLEGHKISYKSYLDLTSASGFFYKTVYRIIKRAGTDLQRVFNVSNPWAISHAPIKMYKAAIKESADLYSAHLECAFYAGRRLIKNGKNVSFDFEDWYSRDYLMPSRPVKLLSSLEEFALHNGLFCTTTSQCMAEALKADHSSKNDITVIYNGFSIQENNNASSKDAGAGKIKLLWFSRTIGSGRGLEFFINALQEYDHPVELNLLGNMEHGYKDYLDLKFPFNKHSLKTHSFIPHSELDQFISQFDIGLAIEENINDNKSLTISNKILQYIQAGIPVLASDTKGQREVASDFSSVIIVDITKSDEIVNGLEALRKKDFSRQDEREIFKRKYSCEAQEKKLEKLLQHHYEF